MLRHALSAALALLAASAQAQTQRGPARLPPRPPAQTAPAPGAAEVLRARAAHGYGLLLIRRLVAQVGYAYRRGVNEVRLTARREG